MSEKIQITDKMVSSFAEMIKSKDAGDTNVAMEILNNRDKTDPVSEDNFLKISSMIIDDDQLFPSYNMWTIQIGGKTLVLDRGVAVWSSESGAKSALSRHLTKYLGKSPKTYTLTSTDKRFIYNKTHPKSQYEWRNNGEEYDPNFDTKKYIKDLKEKTSKEIGQYANYWNNNKSYFRALKSFFGGGNELRDFLIENKVIQIMKLK